MPKQNRPFKSLETSLSYNFQDQELLRQALTRRSAVEEHIAGAHQNDNQRLEMLGDTVLRTQLTRIIFQYPQHFSNEEAMTRKIDSMVNKTRQAEIARTLNLQNYIICGRSEQQILNGPNSEAKDTILSDTLEALLGAIDSVGVEKQKAIKNVIKKLWMSDLSFLNVSRSVATSQSLTSTVITSAPFPAIRQPALSTSVIQSAPIVAQQSISTIGRSSNPMVTSSITVQSTTHNFPSPITASTANAIPEAQQSVINVQRQTSAGSLNFYSKILSLSVTQVENELRQHPNRANACCTGGKKLSVLANLLQSLKSSTKEGARNEKIIDKLTDKINLLTQYRASWFMADKKGKTPKDLYNKLDNDIKSKLLCEI